MKRISFAVLSILFVTLTTAALYAQQPPPPAPELKKLDMFTGSWIAEGTMSPGPGFPGRKFAINSNAEWMEGNYFVVEHGDFDFGAVGKGKELTIMGYDPDRKVYTYTAFNSLGQAETSTGTVDGDTWTWSSDEHFGGMTMKGRFTMKVLSPTSYTMKFELSQDGKDWNTAMEGKATKK